MFVHCQIYENIKYNVNLNSLSDYQFVLTNVLKDKNNSNIYQKYPILGQAEYLLTLQNLNH